MTRLWDSLGSAWFAGWRGIDRRVGRLPGLAATGVTLARRHARVLHRRWRGGQLRVTLGTRILLVFVTIATASTALSVLMQDSALSADLRSAANARLQRTARLVVQLLDERLESQVERYRGVASSPQFLANVEADHQPTLAYFAEQLRPVHGAAAILFLDAEAREVAGSGDAALRAAACAAPTSRAAPRRSTTSSLATTLTWQERPFAVVSIPIRSGSKQSGTLVAVEEVGAADIATWTQLCRARISFGSAATPSHVSVPACAVGDLQLWVEQPFDAESEALLRSRENLLAGGMLGLAIALAASLLLARSLVRPIVAIQRAAERIGAGELQVRLGEVRNDEVGDVARSFNLMLDNLQSNIRERSRVESQVRHLAFHDSLTGLPNRRLLKQRLADGIDFARSRQSLLALFFLDLDRFKNVNDTLGHTAGDALLLEVARRLDSCVQVHDVEGSRSEASACIARLGGDEFTLMLAGVEDRAQVSRLADSILAALAVPFEISGHDVAVNASVGIALSPDDGQDAETLLRDSDMAMFHAKSRGGCSYEFYADAMEEIVAKRASLENKLQRALENGEFQVFYQPKLDLETNQVTGMEALLRWRTADQQSVSPDEFVPIAEDTGAIVAIGDWVLRTAVEQSLAWQAEGLRPVKISVNVSPRQMEPRDDLFGKVRDLLAETGLDPRLLELEITESSLMSGEDTVVELLEQVRALGVGLSLDDFGTGYSSLSYLRRLPIDTLKIDRSFVQSASDNPADVALVGSIVAMAKVLGLRVIVEGVETRKQRRFLENLGCDEIQGYLISPAVCADEAAKIMRTRRRKPAATRRVGTRRKAERRQ